jgi:predicted dehydrogenase
MVRVGILGAGTIGRRRAAALGPEAELVVVADTDQARAEALAVDFRAKASVVLDPTYPDGSSKQMRDVLGRPSGVQAFESCDVVIVSTIHSVLAQEASAALGAGKHVLVEKPAGRNPDEVFALLGAQEASRRILRVGCNHRFHPAFQAIKHGPLPALGRILNIRARYGHGGRLGYEKEWRADPALSGGGELLDQGSHLIDLCNWFSPSFHLEWGSVSRQFWDMPVEDNAVVSLRSLADIRATLQVSCTEWKNLFDFEIFCQRGKYQVTGLGRSYGEETLRIYEMGEAMGPPECKVLRYGSEDVSWRAEWLAFLDAIDGKPTDNATIGDAFVSMALIYQVYERCRMPWVKQAGPEGQGPW